MHSTVATQNPTKTPRVHPLRFGQHVVAPSLGVADGASASVFATVRQLGPISRDAIARATSLSIATVNRQVTALLAAELMRERPDLAASGAIGRPRVPIEVNHDAFLAVGVHIGATSTKFVAVDLLGRTLDSVETPTPSGPQKAALAAVTASVTRYLQRWRQRPMRPLWVGVAIGGAVDATAGTVDHGRLGWAAAPVGPAFAQAVGLPVSIAPHVDAMAAAELLFTPRRPGQSPTTCLYVYARETVGYSLVIDGRVHTPSTGPGSIAGLPVQSKLLQGSGTLESTVSDQAVLAAARRLEILSPDAATMPALLRAAGTGNRRAHQLLTERGRVLGESMALLRDLFNPDEVVVGGQAFTSYPDGMAATAEAFRQKSALPRRTIRATRFGDRVQESGAGIVALAALYADPLASMRRALNRPIPRTGPHLVPPEATA